MTDGVSSSVRWARIEEKVGQGERAEEKQVPACRLHASPHEACTARLSRAIATSNRLGAAVVSLVRRLTTEMNAHARADAYALN